MPISIAIEERFTAYHTLTIDDDGSGIGNAQELALGFFVGQSVVRDGSVIGIRKQGELNFVFLGEFVENFDRVVADANDLNVCFLELVRGLMQLNQLLNAERSPIRRAEEDQGDFLPFLDELVEGSFFSVLILELEGGSFRSHL